MVSPVTGPFVKREDLKWFWQEKTWYRQKRPYTQKLAFVQEKGVAFAYANRTDGWRWASFARTHNNDPGLYAKAYDRLVEQLGEGAGLGVTLAQWRQADEMIRDRAGALTRFTRALTRGDPKGVSRALAIPIGKVQRVMQKKYRNVTSLASLWLEFHFGWEPMVKDIYAASKVFDNFIPWATLRSSATSRGIGGWPAPYPFTEAARYNVKSVCKLGVDVRLVNPRARQLQQLGLANPALVVWDVIPWSFVVGWFSNVDSWLGSFTDFLGYETSNGFVSRMTTAEGKTFWPDYPDKDGPGLGVAFTRTLFTDVPRPQLVWEGISFKPIRGLTAISLLVQKLHAVGNRH